MKKFTFKLSGYLQWKASLYQQAELRYAQAMKLQCEAEAQREASAQRLLAQQQLFQAQRQSPQLAQVLQQGELFLQKEVLSLNEWDQKVEHARHVAEVLLKEMLNKKSDLDAIEKLCEKKLKSYTFDQNRREEKEVEDLALRQRL
jgi:transcription termination factor NusB